MKNLGLVAGVAALVASTTGVAHADEYDQNGFYVGAGMALGEFDIDYANPGTPEGNALGGFGGGFIGYSHEIGPIVAGVEVDYLAGQSEDSQRDGNYLVREQRVDAYKSARVLVGLPLMNNRVMPYATGGVGEVDMTHRQSCPTPAAVVAGHCKTQGPYDLSEETTAEAEVYGAGIRIAASEHLRIDLAWLRFETDTDTFAFYPTGAGIATPDVNYFTEHEVVRLGVAWQF